MPKERRRQRMPAFFPAKTRFAHDQRITTTVFMLSWFKLTGWWILSFTAGLICCKIRLWIGKKHPVKDMSMKEGFMLRFKDGFAKIMSFSNVFNVYVLVGIWFAKKICAAGIRRTMCVCAAEHKNQWEIFNEDKERLLTVDSSENELWKLLKIIPRARRLHFFKFFNIPVFNIATYAPYELNELSWHVETWSI